MRRVLRPHFYPVSEVEVSKLIKGSASKSCELDPIPTQLLKDNIQSLITPIKEIVNMSLTSGVFPTKFKEALVFPLLKKSKLDPNVLKNYRPVSNLSFISKITEKAVAARFNKHLSENGLHEPM